MYMLQYCLKLEHISHRAVSLMCLGPPVCTSTFSHWVVPGAMTPLQGDSLTEGSPL